VEADRYRLVLSRYVHLNLLRLKQNASFSAVEKRRILKTYTWSSYPGYINLRKRAGFLRCAKILSMPSMANPATSRKAYRQLVEQGIRDPSAFHLKEEVKAQTVLGSDDFGNWLRDHFRSRGKRFNAGLPAARSLSARDRSPGDMAAQLALKLAVTIESLQQPGSCTTNGCARGWWRTHRSGGDLKMRQGP
jgi:hypothetical protein